jgi:hypothetical protein
VRLGLVTLAAAVALGAAAPAHASSPLPWCGTTSASADRLPDATQAYSIHAAYVRATGAPDRFGEWAPRIVGDVAAMDAWWRSQDPARAPRFDTFPVPGCATAFGTLDITNVELSLPVEDIGSAFNSIRRLLASNAGFSQEEKIYLVYYDGPTGQDAGEQICGQGAVRGLFGFPGLAVVYVDSCNAENSDVLRPVVAVHELVHAMGAVNDGSPNACEAGHVCDFPNDLMTASLSGRELETHVLDVGRDDYYGHGGRWTDVQDSLFLEPLDSPDRTPPSVPGALRAGDDRSGMARLSWRASTDDVGPVSYRIYQSSRFLREVRSTSVLVLGDDETTEYSVRAVDEVGRLSPVTSVRFREGVGMVNAAGRLVRDTVRPPAIARVAIRRGEKTVRLAWPAVRDAGGIRSYRVRSAGRTTVVRKPSVALALSRLRGAVTITAVDRAGNVGPATTIPLRRLR